MNNINPQIFPLISTEFTIGASPDEKKPERCIRDSLNECYNGIKGSKTHASLGQKVHVRPNTNLVEDYFELYLPVYSNLGWEIAQPNYDRSIRFIITLSPKTLLKLFTRRWY